MMKQGIRKQWIAASGGLCLGLAPAGHLAGAEAVSNEAVQLASGVKRPEQGAFPVDGALVLGWESSYISEGRNNLDGDDLWGATFELTYQGFIFGTWYANSPQADYDELNFWLQYDYEIGDFEISAAYNHLRFPEDGQHDNELGLGVSYNGLPWDLAASVLGYYSFEAEGSFFELALTGGYEVAPRLALNPYLVFGMNNGYVVDGHNGANHLALGVEAVVPLTEYLSLMGHVSQNWAIDADPVRYSEDDTLKDFFHGGISLQYSF